MSRTKFEGTQRYITTRDLEIAVNASVTLGRPLLVKGEPGTGKTVLAEEVAAALQLPLLTWHIKSTTKAAQARGDFEILIKRDRRVLRVHLGPHVAAGLATLKDAVRQALA